MKPMDDRKKLLVSLVQVVLFLFVAFGGFLKNIAPPDEASPPAYYVGIVSFLMLIMLLTVSAVGRRARGQKYRIRWMAAGIGFFLLAIPPALIYPRTFQEYTYPSPQNPNERRIKGSDNDLQKSARDWIQTHYKPEPSDLVRKFPPGQVWTQESIERAKTILLVSYGGLVLSVAGAIFCLIEANVRTA